MIHGPYEGEISDRTWDASNPHVAGLKAFNALLNEWEAIRSYTRKVAELQPSNWTISELDKLLPKCIKVLGGNTAYQRGHHLRAMAVLAAAFGVSRPPMRSTCWQLLMEYMPGTHSGAKDYISPGIEIFYGRFPPKKSQRKSFFGVSSRSDGGGGARGA